MNPSSGVRERAARNLLVHCGGLSPGDRLLIVHEVPGLGYYDDGLAPALAEDAQRLGVDASLLAVPFAENIETIPQDVVAQMEAATCTLFLARVADQLRFRAMPADRRLVVSYALDLEMLRSEFGAARYEAFVGLKCAIDAMLSTARDIHVTCPLGTDFAGTGIGAAALSAAEVSVIRFPMSIFTPVLAAGFSGHVAIAGFLVGTGSRYYEPFGLPLTRPLHAHFSVGRLTGFSGDAFDVARANRHYDDIAGRFGLARDAVHSWHAGLHPGCRYRQPVERDYKRWSGSAFGNPRILHFHTCGEEPPGEISWTVVDPTIRVDGIAIVETGRMHPERIPGAEALLARFPCAAALFADPAREVGIDIEELVRRGAAHGAPSGCS